jgi:FkbM family methyltransferase
MLIEPEVISKYFNIIPKSILHIGAHTAEEKTDYINSNWGSQGITWVEAQKDLSDQIEKRPLTNDKVINCLAWNENNQLLKFKKTNNSQSSSILDFGTHKKSYPTITVVEEVYLKSVRLDALLHEDEQIDLINVDVQGVEKEVLEGLGKIITNANYIYTEVNRKRVYENCTLIHDLDAFLKQYEFKRVVTKWMYGAGWGDALYIKFPKRKDLITGQYLNLQFLYCHILNMIRLKITRRF